MSHAATASSARRGFSGDRTDAAGPVVEALARGGPALPDLRDAGRAHAGAGAARAPRAIPTPATSRCSSELCGPVLARCLRDRHPHRQQLRRGQSARRGAAHRALAREHGLRAAARSRWSRATTSSGARAAPRCATRATGGAIAGATPPRSSAPTPISAPSRSPRRSPGADIVVTGRVADSVAGGRPAARTPSAGARDDWDRLAARRPWPAICSNAARRSPAAISPTRGYKDVPGLADVGYPIAEIDADGALRRSPSRRAPAAASTAHGQRAGAVRSARPGGLSHARRGARSHATSTVEELGPDRVRAARRARQAGAGDAEGDVCIDGGCARRGRDLLCRAARRGARAARGRGRCASGCAGGRSAELRVDLIGVLSVLGDDAGALAGRPAPARRATCGCALPRNRQDRADGRAACSTRSTRSTARSRRRRRRAPALTPRLASASCLIEREYARRRASPCSEDGA